MTSLRLVACLVLGVLGTASALGAANNPLTATAAVIAGLRTGGYTIVVVHSRTDPDHEDVAGVDAGDCANQRGLSDLGRLNASGTGKLLRRSGVPVSNVVSGAFCRTAETAERLDLAPVALDHGLDIDARPEDLRLRASRPLSPGANIVLVTHPSNVSRSWPQFAKANEADVLVLRADGRGSSELIARMSIEELSRYAKSEQSAQGH